ncbi:MAG: hypothetical protein SNF33_07080 [Candidatus Algichlamydia australiensis]|nr:hypothetical protein [Chlamydiales bacterium]
MAEEKLIWKVFPVDEQAIMITEDYQIWLLHGVEPNKLTWTEWIKCETIPQPDTSYFFDVKQWEKSKAISIVYSPWQECEWKETYRNDSSLLQYCDYVISNTMNNVHAFAKPLQKDELISFYNGITKRFEIIVGAGLVCEAANLLEKVLVFTKFKTKVLAESKNKSEGKPYEEKYIEFHQKHDFFFLET